MNSLQDGELCTKKLEYFILLKLAFYLVNNLKNILT